MKKLKYILICCVWVFTCTSLTFAQQTYSKISIELSDPYEMDRLAGLDLDVDHPEFDKEGNVLLYLTSEEVAKLRYHGFRFDTIVPDFREYYEDMLIQDAPKVAQMTRSSMVADGFDLGAMGGFYTFSEVEAKLDEMKVNYPNLVTTKSSIGTSIEGRPIWMVKISDNPNIDEPEPAAYFDALHHAREPLAMAATINYMFWLLENYETDPRVKFLVDNREMYFVPVVNPDGYVYNELTDPNGGGLWRKNRNPNGGSCPGVDLNRNYEFGYATNNSCSSPDPCSGVYRGAGPFSEPESVAVRDFLAQVLPNTAFSTHSTAGSYLMPYGFDTSPPDFEIYSEWASSFLDDNDYPYGVTFQMLGYTSCGTTRDYLHSEGIYGWTPEIDGLGFWPPPSTIFELVDENIRPLFYQSWIAGAYLDVQSHEQIGNALPGGSFQLIVEIKNTGVGAASLNTSVVLSTSNPNVTVPTANAYGNVAPRAKKDNSASPFTISLDPAFTGPSFDLTVTTYQDGVENESIVIPVLVGDGTVVFEDDAENGSTNWTASGSGIAWGELVDDSYSGLFSFGDSPGGNSENDTDNVFMLNESFNFDGDFKPVLTFASKWSIESDDIARLEISSDGGINWTTLKQYNRNNDWTNEFFNLTDYVGFTDVRFRFTMNTDSFLPGDGFYFDDFTVTTYDNASLGVGDTTLTDIRLYPNPFADSGFKIEGTIASLDEISEVVIHDIFGRKIAPSVERKGNVIEVRTSRLSVGVYFVSLLNSEGREMTVRKMIRL